MESRVKSSLEQSGWVKVDDATYQLREDYDRLPKNNVVSSLSVFLGLIKAATRSSDEETQQSSSS